MPGLCARLHGTPTPGSPPLHGGVGRSFLKINRAFEVLKDDEQRRKYDSHGEAGLGDGHQGQQGGRRYENWNYYNVRPVDGAPGPVGAR